MNASSSETCAYCGGSGWERIAGGAVRRCRCGDSARVARLLGEARIPKRYESCTLESYETKKDKRSLVDAKNYVAAFLEKYPLDFGLLFLGPCGVGKTHLAVALLKKLISERLERGLFYDFRDLLRAITSVATVSDDYDDRIVAEYGGQTAQERIQDTGGPAPTPRRKAVGEVEM